MNDYSYCMNRSCQYHDKRCEEWCGAPTEYAVSDKCDPRAPQKNKEAQNEWSRR